MRRYIHVDYNECDSEEAAVAEAAVAEASVVTVEEYVGEAGVSVIFRRVVLIQ